MKAINTKLPARVEQPTERARRGASLLTGCLLVVLGLLSFGRADADLAATVHAIRAEGCEGRSGSIDPLGANRELDEVARQWSRGGRLRDAIQRSDYRAIKSASAHIGGTSDQVTIARVLAEQHCDIILDAAFSELGVYTQANQTWLVFARPLEPPAPGRSAEVGERALQLVNEARAKGRRCGKVNYAPVPPLTLVPQLSDAARVHAQDMARHSSLSHEGSDGSRPADRAARAGYRWRAVGENISAGFADIDAVVQGWLDSPGHCSNIMSPRFEEMGIAYVVETKSKAHIYWAQVFAARK